MAGILSPVLRVKVFLDSVSRRSREKLNVHSLGLFHVVTHGCVLYVLLVINWNAPLKSDGKSKAVQKYGKG